MTRKELMFHLERLANVGFGYDINDEDRKILRVAANEIGDVGAAADMYRRKMEECAKMLTT